MSDHMTQLNLPFLLSLIDDVSFPYSSYADLNQLTGTIPSTIGSLTNLQYLYVDAL